jgi:hypothetical protein
MNGTCGHDHSTMGDGGGPDGGGGDEGAQPMTNGKLASHTGMASGNASQGSILTSRRGLEGVHGGCDSGGPG